MERMQYAVELSHCRYRPRLRHEAVAFRNPAETQECSEVQNVRWDECIGCQEPWDSHDLGRAGRFNPHNRRRRGNRYRRG